MYKPLQYIDKTKIFTGLQYHEFSPNLFLSQYVACYWTVYSVEAIHDVSHRIIPDGCVDIVFDLNEKISFITGISDKTEFLNLSGFIRYCGIRFLPKAIPFILRDFAIDSLNSYIEIDTKNKILTEMTKWVLDENDIEKIIINIQKHLEIFFRDYTINGNFNTILNYSLANNGMIHVKDIAGYYKLSEKQIGRYFKENIGISTKPYLKIIRFQNAYRYFLNRANTSIVQAVDSGFYDQSHLIKDIRFYLGDTLY